MTNYDGGPQKIVTFTVTYPGFEPMTEKTGQCLLSAAEYLAPGPGCVPLKFRIGDSNVGELSDDDHFQNSFGLFLNQTPKPGPNGFEVYETGSPQARIRTYRKRTEDHTLLITCLANSANTEKAMCRIFGSLLSNGNGLSYSIDQSRIGEAETIDHGIRSLIRSFAIEGEWR